jgi:hypothetical protein
VRLGAGDAVEPVVAVQCDIRRGRPAGQRERLGAAVAALLEEELGWPASHTILEFRDREHLVQARERVDVVDVSRHAAPDPASRGATAPARRSPARRRA